MKVWTTAEAQPASETEKLWVYNGLDCCVTLEVLERITPQLNEITRATYEFEIALEAPVLEMEARGFLVDLNERSKVVSILTERYAAIEEDLTILLREGLEVEINWNSPAQLQRLFYDVMGLPLIKFQGKVTINRAALEKMKGYFYAEPIVRRILALRDLKKKLGVLKTGIDSDGRIRTSFNVAGTDTGRFSSYTSPFGSGTNLQNITGELRQIFVADPGWKLCYIDKKQAESYAVGAICWNLFQEGSYLDACESGDLHTVVCQLCWDDLAWTSDVKANKVVAEQSFYRHFSYRDAAKRLGHGTNYFGQPQHLSKAIHIPQELVSAFQPKYFRGFPGIRQWHEWVRQRLIRDGWITTFMGRHRQFFGRRWESETLRSAIAFEPQSCVADLVNRGLLRVWRANLPIHLLLQAHDALVFQFREGNEEVIQKVYDRFSEEVPLLHGRSMNIPSDIMVGWNWAYASEKNPDGLIKFGDDKRQRQNIPAASFMDRKFY